jgi:hypothetical protein
MGRERKALADRVQSWRAVTDNLRNDLEQFPQLAGSLADLEGIDAEARALIAELSVLRARLQSKTARLRALARRGDMTRTRIGAGLRAALGYESAQLLRYGLRPRAQRRVDEGPAAEPAASAPPEPDDGLGGSQPS